MTTPTTPDAPLPAAPTPAPSNALVLPDPEQLAAALEGVNPSDLELPRVKVPGGGSTTWEIPTGDPENPVSTRELVGVVVDDYAVDSLYLAEYDGSDNPPDALWIGGQFMYANDDAIAAGVVPDRETAAQPLNQYDPSLGRTPIANRWRLFVLQPGSLLPLQVDVPVMSRKKWVNFKFQNFGTNGLPTTAAVVRLTLRREENAGGNPYAQIIPALVNMLEAGDRERITAHAASIRALTRRAPVAPSEQAPAVNADDFVPAAEAAEAIPEPNAAPPAEVFG